MLTQINWPHLMTAYSEYLYTYNYTYIDTPWIVSNFMKNFTFTGNADIHSLINDRALVGSAEQGFVSDIHLLKKDIKYCSIGPCFRVEEEYSDTHREYFMKMELFIWTDDKNKVFDVLADAKNVFSKFIAEDKISVVQIDINSFDILINNIEVGSYGYRKYNGLSWVYGTGIAEPRLSIALGKK